MVKLLCYMACEVKVAYGVKVANQLSLKWEGDLKHSGRPSLITMVLINGRGRQESRLESKIQKCYISGFEDGERGEH